MRVFPEVADVTSVFLTAPAADAVVTLPKNAVVTIIDIIKILVIVFFIKLIVLIPGSLIRHLPALPSPITEYSPVFIRGGVSFHVLILYSILTIF